MSNQSNIDELLSKASLMKQQWQKQHVESGERFNIFSILRLEKDEERLHSRFIAGLLNPKASHGQGTLFLKKFLKRIMLPGLDISAIEETKVFIEEDHGPVSTDCLNGGCIDIVIKIPHNQVIVIENKVDAGDQKHQLIRYRNAYPNAYILYLTKTGEKPSSFSTHNQITDEMVIDFDASPGYKCISYKDFVLPWVKECYDVTDQFPSLHKTLHQYMETVKRITGQSTANDMADEFAKVIVSSNEYLNTYFSMRGQNVAKAIERRLLYQFIDEMKAIAKETGLIYDEKENDREFGHVEKGSRLTFLIPDTSFHIELGFSSWRMGFYLGIIYSGEKDDERKQIVADRFSKLLGKATVHERFDYLLYFKDANTDSHLHEWRESSFEVWGALNDGKLSGNMKKYFADILKGLTKL